MNCRTLLVLCVVLLAASTAFAIQTGKLRVRDKAPLDATLPADGADPLNIVDETVLEQANAKKAPTVTPVTPKRATKVTADSPKPKKAVHTGKTGSDKAAEKKSKINTGAESKATKTAAKTDSKSKKVPIYLRTDGLPEYAAKAKELLAAAADQSWPGEPLVQGCTPLECQQWCEECGSTATCENRCFLYSQCNDEC